MRARFRFLENTDEPSPYSTPLAIADRFLVIVETAQKHDRTEHLFVHDAHVGRDVGQDRRFKIVAFVGKRALATGHDASTLCNCALDKFFDNLELQRGDHCPDVDDTIAAAPLSEVADQFGRAFFKGVVDGVLYQDSFRGDAVLTAVDEATAKRGVNSLLDVGVVANDERVLASKLHHDGDDPAQRSPR